MMLINLLILALLGAWMLQITLVAGAAIFLVVRSAVQRDRRVSPAMMTGAA